jgi:hypothetical protein
MTVGRCRASKRGDAACTTSSNESSLGADVYNPSDQSGDYERIPELRSQFDRFFAKSFNFRMLRTFQLKPHRDTHQKCPCDKSKWKEEPRNQTGDAIVLLYVQHGRKLTNTNFHDHTSFYIRLDARCKLEVPIGQT